MDIVKAPTALPGHCFFCKSPNRDSFLDTRMSLDYEGAIYICCECVREFAQAYDFITPNQSIALRKSKDDLETINYTLIKRLGALEESLRALADAGYGGNSVSSKSIATQINLPGTEAVGSGEEFTSESLHDEDLGELLADVSAGDSARERFDL